MTFRNGRCTRAEVDGDLVNLPRLHQLGLEQGVAIATAKNAGGEIDRNAVGANIDDLDDPVGVGRIGTDEELGFEVAGKR